MKLNLLLRLNVINLVLGVLWIAGGVTLIGLRLTNTSPFPWVLPILLLLIGFVFLSNYRYLKRYGKKQMETLGPVSGLSPNNNNNNNNNNSGGAS